MNKLNHTFAFEILVESVVKNFKTRELMAQLIIMAEKLDAEFKCNCFSPILDKSAYYKNRLSEMQENLFLENLDEFFLLSSEQLISYADRLKVYIIINSWKVDFGFPIGQLTGIASGLKIETETALQISTFFDGNLSSANSKDFFSIDLPSEQHYEELEGSWIEQNKTIHNESKADSSGSEKGKISVLFLDHLRAFLISCKERNPICRSNQKAVSKFWALVEKGAIFEIAKTKELSFADLKQKLIDEKFKDPIYISTKQAAFHYPNGHGIAAFNIFEKQGQLIGIIGKEGSGKSTFLKLLSGIETPDQGKVCVNNYDLQKNYFKLSSLIGFVPEEDLLFEELTVYENLYYASRLTNSSLNKKETDSKITDLLSELELLEIAHVHVGKAEEKRIQPGQRRLINIALELLRDPDILIIDNAVSPLSMNESTIIIEFLFKLSLQGKLIITTITQVPPPTFENFDRMIALDKGYLIYSGKRETFIEYFVQLYPRGAAAKFNEAKKLNAESALEIIELKKNDLYPNQLNKRYHQAPWLYSIYKENLDLGMELEPNEKKSFPARRVITPKLERQYAYYSFRNFKAKLARKKDLLYTILVAPALALTTGIILKYDGETSTFSDNTNIPIFFFISCLISLFLGMIQAHNEILKERNILKKESYLNLSQFSYINSKISYLIVIVLCQSILYTLFSYWVIGIKGMFFYHWPIYFSTEIFGVLLGLVFSSLYTNASSILIKAIPIVILLQIIFGGGIVNLDKVNFSNKKHTPVLADLQISKWAYEALIVSQFAENRYQSLFQEIDEKISQSNYYLYEELPLLQRYLEQIGDNINTESDSIHKDLEVLKLALKDIEKRPNTFPFEFTDNLKADQLNENIIQECFEYLEYLQFLYHEDLKIAQQQKLEKNDSLNNLRNSIPIQELLFEHHNFAVASLVLNNKSSANYTISDNRIVQLSDPIFQMPKNNYGRTRLFLNQKMFNGELISTKEFNLSIIWLFNLILYLLLVSKFDRIFKKTA